MKKNNLKHTSKNINHNKNTHQHINLYKPLLIVFFVPVLLYIQTLSFGYTNFDDNVIIQSNTDILSNINNLPNLFLTDAFLNGSSEYYRPLQSVLYMFSTISSGVNTPIMFHFTNLLLIGLISCSLLLLLIKLKIPSKIALLGTLVFCVNPLFVSNIAWIPALGDLLLTLFSILSFIFLIQYFDNKKTSNLIYHWIAFTLALFSKETAVLLPFLYLIYYLFFIPKVNYKIKDSLPIILYFFSGIIWLWFRSKAISSNSSSEIEISYIPELSLTFISKLQTIPESLFAFLLPYNIAPIPDFSIVKTAIGMIILILIVILVFKNSNRSKKEKSFGILWFIILLLPALLFNKDIYYDYLNHRFLLPLVGILILILFSLPTAWIEQSKYKNSWIFIFIIVVFSSFTYVQSRAYSSPINFYNSAISSNEKSELAYNNRGFIFGEAGKFKIAIDDFSKAININNRYYVAYFNRALMKSNLNLTNESLDDYTKAIELNKNYYEAYYNRGYIYGTTGQLEKAISDFSKAIEIKPDYAQAINNRGITYLKMGAIEKSCNDFKKASELGSKSAKENLIKYCK